jgi:hypothetical protein
MPWREVGFESSAAQNGGYVRTGADGRKSLSVSWSLT